MKRTILSLLVAGLFAGAGIAGAEDVQTGNKSTEKAEGRASPEVDPITRKPADSAQQTNPTKEGAAQSTAKADYTAAKDKAQSEYKDAKAKCDGMQGDAMRSCVTDAKKVQTEALAQAKTQWEGQGEMKAKDGANPAKDDMGNSATQPKNPQ